MSGSAAPARSRPGARLLAVVLALAVLVACGSGNRPKAAPPTGTYYTADGDRGYDVGHYDLRIRYTPARPEIAATDAHRGHRDPAAPPDRAGSGRPDRRRGHRRRPTGGGLPERRCAHAPARPADRDRRRHCGSPCATTGCRIRSRIRPSPPGPTPDRSGGTGPAPATCTWSASRAARAAGSRPTTGRPTRPRTRSVSTSRTASRGRANGHLVPTAVPRGRRTWHWEMDHPMAQLPRDGGDRPDARGTAPPARPESRCAASSPTRSLGGRCAASRRRARCSITSRRCTARTRSASTGRSPSTRTWGMRWRPRPWRSSGATCSEPTSTARARRGPRAGPPVVRGFGGDPPLVRHLAQRRVRRVLAVPVDGPRAGRLRSRPDDGEAPRPSAARARADPGPWSQKDLLEGSVRAGRARPARAPSHRGRRRRSSGSCERGPQNTATPPRRPRSSSRSPRRSRAGP